jgi:general secretion pathway protein J
MSGGDTIAHRGRETGSRSSAGFSLVEVLIALFITAMLAGLGTSLLLGTLDGQERLERTVSDARRLELAHATLKTDLSQLAARPTREPGGQVRETIFAGGDLEAAFMGGALLAFARAGWDNPDGAEPRGSIVYVEYLLRDGALVRRSWARADQAERTPMIERVLLDRVTAASVSFSRRGVWDDGYVAATGEIRSGLFPDLVALDLKIEGLGDVRQVFATGYAS